ncbi:aldo/keto reductase [Chitinophaga sedimenti]|uniref:aldo/keto reductase n=1 Tax=Chitinophaga sedimenti TaxID=2033606 RepID=UPI002002B056|nr:aldo/keto reductase [Chitinophaga sedimenti]MCK7554718.1 aldo/keto reductase [Chitinophaga sedimenti]
MMAMNIPKVIFGTSALGNLYTSLTPAEKTEIVKACIAASPVPAVFDTAGKYGAGLALEALGNSLRELGVPQQAVMISNKLGWYRIPLTGDEPAFEPGVWKDIQFDAEQRISYEGILQCYEQGNELLGGYHASLVSVHDPDEYLAAAVSGDERAKRLADIKDAYRALFELKSHGRIQAVGVGAKDWRVIREITDMLALDWVMIANSMTLHTHPDELLDYMAHLQSKGTGIINSAVFNGGFLTGGDYYNYRLVDKEHVALMHWRDQFLQFAPILMYNRHTPAYSSD